MKRTWIVAALAAVVLVVGFVLSVPHARDLGVKPAPQAAIVTPPVFVHDSYKKGTHSLTVSVAAPNACTSVTTTASLADAASSTPAVIQITVSMPADSGVCLQGVATTTTALTLTAPQSVSITASVNGASATVVPN